jgi:BMFP domain-containing protein YqiC
MNEASRRQQVFDKLRQERDELRVQVELGKAEFRDEWQELEHKFENMEARLSGVAREARQSSEEVGAAFGLLADELGQAYRNIRARLG